MVKVKANFTLEEKSLLLKFIKDNSAVIENKANDHKIITAKKGKWLELSNLFHQYGYERDWQRLREYYQRAKSHAKRTILNYQQGITGTSAFDRPSRFDWAIYNISPEDFAPDKNEENLVHQPEIVLTTAIKEENPVDSESLDYNEPSHFLESYNEENGEPLETLDISESSDASIPPAGIEPEPFDIKPCKMQKLCAIDKEFLKAQLEFLEKRNRREQELHETKMRVEQLKMRNEELLNEKLKLEIERLQK